MKKELLSKLEQTMDKTLDALQRTLEHGTAADAATYAAAYDQLDSCRRAMRDEVEDGVS